MDIDPQTTTTDSPTQYKQWIYSAGSLTLEAYKAQASGHSAIFTIENNTKIVKPLNPHEATIYEELQNVPQLLPHVPRYFGRVVDSAPEVQVRGFQTKGEYVVLSNLTAGYVHPCVMDIKLGQKNYVENGTLSPMTVQKRKIKCAATTASQLGFRISGMRVYRPLLNNYLIRKTVTSTRMLSQLDGSLLEAMKLFLHDGGVIRTHLIVPFVEKLEALAHAIKSQHTFDFLASSALLIYDGAPHVDPADAKVDVYLIDFDHTIILKGGNIQEDTGVRLGVQSLALLFRKLMTLTMMSQSTFALGTRDSPDDTERTRRRRSQSNPMLISPRGSSYRPMVESGLDAS